MSDISKVRSICQDIPVPASEDLTLDGIQITAQLTYYPVVLDSVIITSSNSVPAYTVDLQTGIVTFASIPTAGTYSAIYSHTLLLDDDIQVFLDIEEESTPLAAAMALEAIAASQALILKKIKSLDLQTDGPAVADSLLKLAKSIRDRVSESEDTSFEIVDQINDWPGYTERIRKEFQRGG